MNAKEKRAAAILAIQNKWIETEDPISMGKLLCDGSFAELKADVEDLRRLSRLETWQKGIDNWAQVVETMHNIFRDTWACDSNVYDTWISKYGDYTPCTAKEFAGLIKHAVFTGMIHVWGI